MDENDVITGRISSMNVFMELKIKCSKKDTEEIIKYLDTFKSSSEKKDHELSLMVNIKNT